MSSDYKLDFSEKSRLQVRAYFYAESSKSLFDQFKTLINKSRATILIQHNTLNELVELIGVSSLLNSLPAIDFSELMGYYEWTKNSFKAVERRMTSLINNRFKTLESLKIDTDKAIINSELTALNARMGTGKTQHVCVPFCENARKRGLIPVVLCHRISLCGELSTRTNTVNYQKLTDKNSHLTNDRKEALKNGFTVCLNSICNPKIQSIIDDLDGKYVLFIDEYQQSISAIAGKHVKAAQQEPILVAIMELMKNAKSLIVADADLNDYTLNLAKYIRQQPDPAVYFANNDLSKKTVTISLAHGKDTTPLDAMMAQIVQALQEGKKIVVYSNRQRVCSAVKSLLTKFCPEKETILICGDGLGDTVKYEAFKQNAENESQNYDCVIISPSITSGVSVSNPDFKTAFCFFNGSSIAHFEAIQQMHRFRSVDKFNICLSTMQQINDLIILKPKDYAEALTDSSYSNYELDTGSNVNRLIAKTEETAMKSRQFFPQFFYSRLVDLGYKIHVDDCAEMSALDLSGEVELITEQEKQATLEAKILTNTDYRSIKELITPTDEQCFQVKKHEIKLVLNIPTDMDLSEEYFDLYAGGRGLPAVRRFCAVFGSINNELSEFSEIDKNIPTSRRRFFKQSADLFHRLIESVYGKKVTLDNFLNGELPAVINSNLYPFCRLVEDNALLGVAAKCFSSKQLKAKWKGKNKEPIYSAKKIAERGQLQAFNDVLNRFGIEYKVSGRIRTIDQETGKQVNIREYQPSVEKLNLMTELSKYQQLKTDEIAETLAKKNKALEDAKKMFYTPTIADLSEQENETLTTIVNGIRSQYESLNGLKFRYSCPECYTPTNNYHCACCGAHELSRAVNIDQVSDSTLRDSVFSVLSKKIITDKKIA
jgi:hypothetical protein